jgi:predicted metal-dependent HD superfamily phosphohydrolase
MDMELENIKAYPEVCHKILDDLTEKLPGHLTYHSLSHIIDVANVCNRYIDYYMVSERAARLIRIAAVAHDYGYIFTPVEHEERSIVEIRPLLNGYSDSEISVISGLIRATKVPQQPQNLYEEIIADADLDYLGRDDYGAISEGLYKEFLHFGVVENESDWLELQVKFLDGHRFHTSWAKMHRSDSKQRVLQKLRNELNSRNLSKKAS